ncbi:MAG: alpha/beta hydrolase [Treponema sp.]|nr:alpha/beta hydrolase [Treponema sp.]
MKTINFSRAVRNALLVFVTLASVQSAHSYSKRGYKKIFLWDGIKRMETQVRDTVLFEPDEKSLPASESLSGKTAVIICPGGSYHHLGMSHEGFSSAEWFKDQGIVPFVLQYRVAYNEHHFPAMLEDIQMAIKYVRENAGRFGIDKRRVGAIGYSAGGHLVTMAAEFGETRNELHKLGVETSESLRPDFVMPIYPVVSMQDDVGHRWSRKSLLGHQYKNAEKGFSPLNPFGHKYSQQMKDEFSMELNVPEDMVPVYLLACRDDPVVMFENSVRLDEALSAKAIPHRFVVYDEGGHGFGMKNGEFMRRTHWNEDLRAWLIEQNFL